MKVKGLLVRLPLMKRLLFLLSSLLMVHGWAAPPSVAAQPVRIDLGSPAVVEGFSHYQGGTTTFGQTAMTIETEGFEEWAFAGALWNRWRLHVERSRGWAVEVRVRVRRAGRAGCDGSVGIWIHDGSRIVKLALGAESVGLSYPVGEMRPVITTDGFHVYRVEAKDDWVRVRQDGRELLFLRGPQMLTGGGSDTLMFGDLGDCGHSSADWDWIAFDTSPQLEQPPCDDCVQGADPLLVETRRLLGPTLPAQARGRLAQIELAGTSTGDSACAARFAADLWLRRLLPRVYDAAHDPEHAQDLRELPSLRTTLGLRAALTLTQRIHTMPARRRLPGCDPVPEGGLNQCQQNRMSPPQPLTFETMGQTIRTLTTLVNAPQGPSAAAESLRQLAQVMVTAQAMVTAQQLAPIHRGTVWLYRNLVEAERVGVCGPNR